MTFARSLERLRRAAAVGMPGCPPGKVTVDVRDLRSLLYHFDLIDAELRAIHQAAASDSQTADSEPQAGLRRNGETQECPCNACHKERLAANPPADRTGSLMALASRGMVLCPACGNKRCPHANDHRNACTGSNELGQVASHGDHSMLREFVRANLGRLIAAGAIDPAKAKHRLEELNIGKPLPQLPDDFILVQHNPDKAVCLDGSRFHGWLMYRHPGGQFVSERKLEQWELMQAEDQWHYGIVLDGVDQQKGSV